MKKTDEINDWRNYEMDKTDERLFSVIRERNACFIAAAVRHWNLQRKIWANLLQERHLSYPPRRPGLMAA